MQDAVLVFCRDQQQAGLIARTLRYREYFCLPVPFDTGAAQVLSMNPKGLIIAGKGSDALDGLDFSLLDLNIPVLALDGAAALLCARFGGSAVQAATERGFVTLGFEKHPLFADVSSGERMMGGLQALNLPDSLLPIATATEQVIGYAHTAQPLYAIQYPVERNDPDAAQLLANFADLCGLAPEWNEETIIANAVESIRAAAPEGRVLCAVSGGVDSAVCAKLASMAVGRRLLCVFVDTGMYRLHEPDDVIRRFMEHLDLAVVHADARESFLRALSGVSDPKDKERIAGQLMNQMLLKQLTYDPEIRTVVMGTNFNDIFFGGAAGGNVPESVQICEPIRNLFKEEVRRLATAMELPAAFVSRQPFPASGLALRVFGSLTEERLQILREADAIFVEEIRSESLDRRLWQYYATLIDSPDVPGGYAVCLRATQAAGGGASAARIPFDVLERAAERIRRELPGVTRIVYDLTPSAHYGELE